MDSIEEIKRKQYRYSELYKQCQEYQNYLDELDGIEKDSSESVIAIQGRKVKKIESKDPSMINIFNHSIKTP